MIRKRKNIIRRWTAILLCTVLMLSAGCTALAEAGSGQGAFPEADRMADTEYSYEPQAEDMHWRTEAKPTSVPVNLPAVPGYQAGKLNGRTYYVKVSGSRMMFYLQRQDGSMNRVAAPYVTGLDGQRYYPLDSGGVVHFPKLTNGRLTAYCHYADGTETPAVIPGGDLAKADSQQQCTVNGRTYIVRISGSRMMFYLQRKDGSLNRVAAPSWILHEMLPKMPATCRCFDY